MARTDRDSDNPTRGDLEAALGRYRPLFGDVVDDWDGFIDALLRPLPTCIWSNPAHIDGAGLATLIAEEGIDPEPIPWLLPPQLAGSADAAACMGDDPALSLGSAFRLPPGFKAGQRWWYCAGLAHAQEEVSQLPVTLLDLCPGQRVLDLCAAPGGKTAQIALALGNRGTLLANDFSPERLSALQGNLDRLGVVNCSSTWCDGGNYPAAAGPFDRILVDAPCSSEGTLRRNRSLAYRIGTERNARMAARQRALLRKAVQLCRPSGRIVYSTCTFAPEENELIVAEALEASAGRLTLLPVTVQGLATSPGVTRWLGRELDASLARCLRVWPHSNDTGGFFVAVLEKAADAACVAEPASARLALTQRRRRLDRRSCRTLRPAGSAAAGVSPAPTDPSRAAPGRCRPCPARGPRAPRQRSVPVPHQPASAQADHRRRAAARPPCDPQPARPDRDPARRLSAPRGTDATSAADPRLRLGPGTGALSRLYPRRCRAAPLWHAGESVPAKMERLRRRRVTVCSLSCASLFRGQGGSGSWTKAVRF